jgi:Asp-tRNA(Asn)/Glu-tRNA(Gln) amidotransferase A subunit family amidase
MNDLEIAYRVMAAPDPADSASSQFPPPNPSVHGGAAAKLMGIYKPWFDNADPPVLKHCYDAISNYQAAGYTLIDVSLPYLPEGQLAHAMTILAEIGSEIHDFTGLNPANKILLSVGKHTPALDFLLAQKLRQLLMQHLAFLFRRHPGLVVISPTSPIAGWHISGGDADLKRGVTDANMSLRNMEYVWLANFTGCPALTIPVGRAEPKEGSGDIPVGLMAMGEWGNEDGLLEWGRIGEQWAWKEERISKPGTWVDVIETARTGII